MTHDLDLRPIALVTGASSGIGARTARRLVSAGYRVFGTSRAGSVDVPGVEALALDVDRDDSVQTCLGELVCRTGRLDVLVNNAGRAMLGACEETSADEARALFETNVFGVMRVVSAVLPILREHRGVIVNVGSLSGFVSVPFHGVYAASKHALAGYTEALRVELAQQGVRVALIEPAAHRTEIQMIRPHKPLAIYDAGRERVEAIIRTQIEQGDTPERVVDAIIEAVSVSSPCPRYRVGRKARLGALARRLLPMRAFESLLRREFQLSA